MRRHLFFNFLSAMTVVLIGAILYFSLTLREQNFLYFHGEKQGAKNFLQEFRKNHRALTELNLTLMYGGSGQFQILHPIFAMRSLHLAVAPPTCTTGEPESSVPRKRPITQCNLDSTAATGASDIDAIMGTKQREYIRALRGEAVPLDFVLKPPFVEDSGSSYAYLLSHKDIPPFNSFEWVRAHLSYFKTTELKSILKRFRIEDPAFAAIAQLNEQEIKAMVEGASLVLTNDFLLLKNESRLGFSPLSYLAYDIRDLRSQLQNQDYDLVSYSPEISCLERIGNACWTYSSKTALAYVDRYSVAISIFAAALLLTLLVIYGRYLAEKNREQRKHRTSLQVLSHEFRTPVSALLLLIDQLSKNLSRLPEADQDTITRMSTEIFRLQRIIEMSKTYLQSTSTATQFNFVAIESINSWIEDFAIEFDSRLYCELLPQDQVVEADPFWLRFVLANLVQNAFAHGREPVHIRLSKKNRLIIISVEDEGLCEFDSLQKMSEAFVKSETSSGMGLGLNITSSIVGEWGGELNFRQSPTTFSIGLNPRAKGS